VPSLYSSLISVLCWLLSSRLPFVDLVHGMKATTASALLGAFAAFCIETAGSVPTVDESYPYTGPAVPVGDWIDPTINGNGKGFPRLVEPPAVVPSSSNPTNNINVIALSYQHPLPDPVWLGCHTLGQLGYQSHGPGLQGQWHLPHVRIRFTLELTIYPSCCISH